MTLDTGLVGHWPLTGDADDYSGLNHHGINHGVRFERKDEHGTVGHFDGRASWIEIPDDNTLALGTGNFTVSAWVHTDAVLDDVIGDIVSKYDPSTMRGLNFNIKNHAGMTSSQSNYRNIHFGIDSGITEPNWLDCGKPGDSMFTCAMAVHAGELYVGTCEPYDGQQGHVYRSLGAVEWLDCGSPDGSNAVMALAVYRGELYAGSACYNTKGSALPEATNQKPGGRIFRYAGGTDWIDCGAIPGARATYNLTVYRDELYGMGMYVPGVFKWDGDSTWLPCGIPGGQRSMSLAVYNGHLYSSGNGSAGVWRYLGAGKWEDCGKQADNTQTYAYAIYEGRMYVGTWPDGASHRYEADGEWTNVGRCGDEKEVMAMAVYNGKMYVGTLPLGQVYRFDGDGMPRPDSQRQSAFSAGQWTLTGQLDTTPDVIYRRVWTMAVYDGRLYAGTLPSGHVYSLETGVCATFDDELPAGWQHVAAVRNTDTLTIYLNGAPIASSRQFEASEFDITCGTPLKIGFGAHDYFNGCISDVRLHNRALSPAELTGLAARHA